MEDGNGIYKDFNPNLRTSINVGYITVDVNEDREQFIEQCLRMEQVSVLVEGGGGVLHGCYITKSALRDISFPMGSSIMGSAVIFHVDPYIGKAIITGVVSKNNESSLNRDEVTVFKRTKDGNIAVLSVDGGGQVNIDVVGVAGSGKLNIHVRNDDYTAEINIHVKGIINVYSEGNTNITAIDGDVNVNTNQNVNINPKQLIVGQGTEPMVKGDELKTQIDKDTNYVKSLKDTLSTIFGAADTGIASGGGTSNLKVSFDIAVLTLEQGDYSDIKSEQSFLK